MAFKKGWIAGCVVYALTIGSSLNSYGETVVSTFDETVKYAVMNNPEVRAAYEGFEATGFAVKGAKGGFLPRLDVSGEYGAAETETPITPFNSYSYQDFRVVITQMLFDGFYTWNRVDEMNNEQRKAYYRLKAAAQKTALEAGRAYIDVMRYQQLVKLAEDNLEQHHLIYQQVEQRTGAGVSRGVDLEQANARLALADYNLLQEVTNLHDVVARFHNVVTALPAEKLSKPKVPTEVIPGTRLDALNKAYELNPNLQEAIANVDAKRSAVHSSRAPFMPELDLRLRKSDGEDLNSIIGDHEDQAIELVFRYNLFRGGSDKAAHSESIRRKYEAMDLRIQACHDVREELVIAYNDITSIEQRLVFLARNELSIEKARIAYRKQFDIGQRTLLDLLDSENEYFDVSRQLVNAQVDLSLARLRTLKAMGVITETMGVSEHLPEKSFELGVANCPPETGPDMSAYFNRKERLLDRLRAGKKESYRMDVRFQFDSDKVDSSYDADLKDAAQYLSETPNLKAQIVGHTDSVGPDWYNLDLSTRRAAAVRMELVKKYGLAPDRLEAVGMGETEPVDKNDTRQGRAANRRVELLLLKEGVKPKVAPKVPNKTQDTK